MSESGIFKTAAKLPPDQRPAYLDEACAANENLRREVESLLRAHDAPGSFLNSEPAQSKSTVCHTPIVEGPGTLIGPYKLMEQIGEGGMGLVFVAEQQHPIRRRVALKIIKPGMDSRQVIARFEAERQALAMMDHQNIAKVHDAGTTESGRPYFVMELVHGVPITEYCDANHLTPRERLELFVPVCQALQHAHQKGIIHRDIKPSNVLVTMYDNKAVPKVIDFGVAKAVDQHLTEKTVYTQFGTMVGTFEYMSPEQADMNAFGVDTRSDIYSLGVLLYELLTGTTPLEAPRLRDAAFGEIVRLIKEEDPPRPSIRLNTSGALAKVAAARKTDPAKLSRLVRGELDWVVMRCLEKDRTRRYGTSSELARDLERYLQNEPVEARPPAFGYRLRKFVQRHRGAAVASSVITLLVAAFLINLFINYGQLKQARDRAAAESNRAFAAAADASKERDRAVDAEKLASEAAEKVRVEAETAKAVNDFVLRLFVKARPNPQQPQGISLQSLLDQSSKAFDQQNQIQPLADAQINEILAYGYQLCSDNERAQSHFERAYHLRDEKLGEANPAVQETLFALASAYDWGGKKDQARPLYEKLLEAHRRAPQPAGTAPANSIYCKALYQLAFLYQKQSNYAAAEPLLAEYLKINQNSGNGTTIATLAALRELAQGYRDQGKPDAAERVYLEVVEHSRGVPGGESWAGIALVELARIKFQQHSYAQAQEYAQNGSDLLEKWLSESWRRYDAQSLLGGILLSQKKFAEAEQQLAQGYEGLKACESNVPVPDRDEYKVRLAEASDRLKQTSNARDKSGDPTKPQEEAGSPSSAEL